MSEAEFERRMARAMRAPVATSERAKRAIMARVRQVAHDEGSRRTPAFPVGRTTRHSILGLALAAGIGSITTLSSPAEPRGSRGEVTSVVIGDSVVDRLRDTLRLVRLIFDDPAARTVAVVGDFNGWRADATRMRRDERTGRWAVTLALHDGEHRYAIVVDNTRQAGDQAARPAGTIRQAYSLLHVARASN